MKLLVTSLLIERLLCPSPREMVEFATRPVTFRSSSPAPTVTLEKVKQPDGACAGEARSGHYGRITHIPYCAGKHVIQRNALAVDVFSFRNGGSAVLRFKLAESGRIKQHPGIHARSIGYLQDVPGSAADGCGADQRPVGIHNEGIPFPCLRRAARCH